MSIKWVDALSPRDRALLPATLPTVLCGGDEVGAGAWAGPVTVCVLQAPTDWHLEGLNDSKKLSPAKRVKLATAIQETASATGIRWVVKHTPSVIIDRLGIVHALRLTYECAMFDLLGNVDQVFTILDGQVTIRGYKHISFVKADTKVPVVMAASILAKISRDQIMVDLDRQIPGYWWKKNKGYGTCKHEMSIRALGLHPIHRRTFVPVRCVTPTGG